MIFAIAKRLHWHHIQKCVLLLWRCTIHNNVAHTHIQFIQNITDSFTPFIPSLSSKANYSIFSILLSLLHPSSPYPPSQPHQQSEGAGSIVIGLQSWQPYDWAVGYCNWITLEIGLVPVRLLKSQFVVYSWRPPIALFSRMKGIRSQLLREEVMAKSDMVVKWPWCLLGFDAYNWKAV